MSKEFNLPDFKNQQFFIGIDVHDKNWMVTINSNKLLLKRFSMNPDPGELARYMEKKYPGGEYFSTYEAGFCGYWIHRELIRLGIKNIISAPTEVPTSFKEKEEKKDPVDSRKLARELENNSLKGIYIPSELQQELRSLVRLRYQQSKNQARLKNQIKGYLHFYGKSFPKGFESRHWSRAFIQTLRNLEFSYPIGKKHLDIQLDSLLKSRESITVTIKSIREFLTNYKMMETVVLLSSIPGIAFITAVTIFSELFDIKRFGNFDQLAKYCGLVPSVQSSSDKQIAKYLSKANNKLLRTMLVESAWTAARKDPAMTACYNTYLRRMSKQETIIRIAKKLLSRIRYVWVTGNKYVYSVVK